MPSREVNAWNGASSNNVHDAFSQSASDGPQSPSPLDHKSSTTSSASSETSDSTDKSDKSGLVARRGKKPRRFPFSSGSMEIETPPSPSPTRHQACAGEIKRNSIFPVGWILGTMVTDIYTAISQWILDGISAWLLQRSFLGNVRRQVFRDLRHRLRTGPLSVLVTPPPMDEMISKKTPQVSDRDVRRSKTAKLMVEPESDLLLIGGSGAMVAAVGGQEETTAFDDGSSHTVQWVIFAIEVMALIPIVVIGLSLFYILAVGIYNDVQDLLRRLFGDHDADSVNLDEENPTSPGEL